MIRCGMIYDMIYLSPAIGLTPGGSAHLHTHSTQNDTINNRTSQITTNFGRVRPVPSLCELYPGICLAAEQQNTEKPQSG